MDFSKTVIAQTGELEILLPPDETPTGAFITIAGPHHPKRKEQQLANERAITRSFERYGKLKFDDPELRYERQTDFLVACTLGWKNIEMDGAPYPFSAENARRLYQDEERSYIRDQVDKGLADQKLFTRSSSGG
jgi:hypothetical protein